MEFTRQIFFPFEQKELSHNYTSFWILSQSIQSPVILL